MINLCYKCSSFYGFRYSDKERFSQLELVSTIPSSSLPLYDYTCNPFKNLNQSPSHWNGIATLMIKISYPLAEISTTTNSQNPYAVRMRVNVKRKDPTRSVFHI